MLLGGRRSWYRRICSGTGSVNYGPTCIVLDISVLLDISGLTCAYNAYLASYASTELRIWCHLAIRI
eukprot:3940756-Rhodomonas_salina.1